MDSDAVTDATANLPPVTVAALELIRHAAGIAADLVSARATAKAGQYDNDCLIRALELLNEAKNSAYDALIDAHAPK